LENKGKERFYADWAEDVRRQFGVEGITILLVKDPGHLQIAVGDRTQRGTFSLDSRDELTKKMLAGLKQHDFDGALLNGLGFINDRIKSRTAAGTNSNTIGNTGNVPTGQPYTPPVQVNSGGGSWGGLVCLGIGFILIVAIIIGVVSRNRGYNAGYGGPPPPGYGGGYYGGGGYGGGGGFGRGLLGGLLGGALGAWGYERFNQGGQSSNYIPPPQGGTTDSFGDTSSSSTGGDFGSSSSSSSDFGGGGGGGGSDFGGGGGGGDFGGGGGGGGDFSSGGGSSGGDF
jgi:hypothetical protein